MDKAKIRSGVHDAYSAAALRPGDEHPFPVGRAFAERLGYPAELLDGLPQVSVDAFAGVSNLTLWADIPEGATVLDLGCGAGMDALVAAGRVGPTGKVIGVDFSETMLARARQGAAETGCHNVEFRQGDAEAVPLEDGQADVALANGIFNLNPAREAIFRELARVLRPGGMVFAAEMILREPLPPEEQEDESNWFA